MTGNPSTVDRRTVLGAVAGLGSASLAGCSALRREDDGDTTGMDEDRLSELAERFAPTLYFDVHEPWFPTDPRPYTSERDGETVVDGFDALNGYHERFEGTAGDPAGTPAPPEPTVFYHGVEYEDSPLEAVQFWFYSAFDQFTTNFHWHDWEVLHVFVDGETDEPQLYVASSHSRRVPNNEFLDPDPEVVPRILPELGSHSSTLSVNEVPDRFQRVSADGLLADITNTAIEGVEDLAEVPLAYGLPRDEGARLPFVVPEYEGEPMYDHERLPAVDRESLVDDALTIRSLDALTSPPTDLPTRETGVTFEHAERLETAGGDADGGDGGGNDDGENREDGGSLVAYDLVETAELEGIDAFVGPQLSFEFAVPEAVEDAVAGHITTTGVPWEQSRYDAPAADITAPNHRAELADRYDAIGEPASVNTVVTRVTEAVTNDDAPENEGLTTTDAGVEAVALLESDPEAVPTFGGVAVVRDVEPGDHRLTVNGAGRAPHSERVEVSGDGDEDAGDGEETGDDGDNSDDEDAGDGSGPVTIAGVDAEVPLVARENATKLAVTDEEAETDVVATALEDDFAGRIYESPTDGSDAVYVHAGGAYTAEVRDGDDEIGAYRINPDPASDDGIRIDRPETGKAPLAGFLTDIAEETRASVATVATDDDGDGDDGGAGGAGGGGDGGPENAVRGLERALAAVVEAAERAEERAREGDRGNADRQLEVVAERLARVAERLEAARSGLPPGLSNATGRRLEQADRRAEQALDAEKL
ncbi:hypothetical protein SAMN04488066_12619 [Halorubrum aquaticum]|uniref:Uncharacterized protein n=1 Tax=Halorubrum aquaticum TaxID=387340 RepID=A0A1I3CPR2_9EURY|nr:hypothetical protein [Halorubrum aquaticum]SFH76373.1 hypothetical protein SAMN04488066_12619 [Halorubrum aquaticum]